MTMKHDKAYLKRAVMWGDDASYCQRAKVGAIIVVDDQNRSDGYNGMPSGMDNVCEVLYDGQEITKPEVLHAESNAILKCAKYGIACNGGTMYCTYSPCFECAKLIIQAGIKRVVYHMSYRLNDGIELLHKAGIETQQIKKL